MNAVQAWQHVYANVEKDRSPRRVGGFQTLFVTPGGLAEPEVEEIEGRLLYFPGKSAPVKRLFFTLSTGKAVLARVVALEGTDELGRGGRYLAHSLIFAPEDWIECGADPLGMLHRGPFFSTLEEAQSRGDLHTGEIPAAAVDCENGPGRSALEAAARWRPEDLTALGLLALRAERLAREAKSLAVVGTPEQIEETLAAALLAVPAALQGPCSFDTSFEGCNAARVHFWTVGLASSPNNPRFVEVDAARRRPAAAALVPETAYERWFAASVRQGRLEELVRHRDAALRLGSWLEAAAALPPAADRLEAGLVASVWEANRDLAAGRLRARLCEHVPATLASALLPKAVGGLAAAEQLAKLRDGFTPAELLPLLLAHWEAGGFRKPPADERDALERLLSAADHPVLRALHACWSDRKDRLGETLRRFPDTEYRRFAELALRRRLVDPLWLAVPRRGMAYLEVLSATGCDAEVGLAPLVRALLEAGEGAALAQLTGRLAEASPQELKKIRNLVELAPDAPAAFLAALEQAIAARPRSPGAWGFLKRLLGGGAPEDSTGPGEEERRD